MTEGMKVKLWGVRGSIPAPHSINALDNKGKNLLEGFFKAGYSRIDQIEQYLADIPGYRVHGWGGNTSCVSVHTPQVDLVIDGGTGIRNYGYTLMAGPCGKGKGKIHIFFTHVHWDHIMGLPFLVPLFIPGNEVHIYGVEPVVHKIFAMLFQKPFFPVPLEMIGAKLIYHTLLPRQPLPFGDLTITPYKLDHPDPCWGYRISNGKSVFSHCVDTECTRVSRRAMGEDLPLYQGVDLMTFDAQYTTKEKFERMHWGHASAALGLDLALRENVKSIVFMHNDPAANDDKIADVESETRRYYEQMRAMAQSGGVEVPEVKWQFGVEGTEFALA